MRGTTFAGGKDQQGRSGAGLCPRREARGQPAAKRGQGKTTLRAGAGPAPPEAEERPRSAGLRGNIYLINGRRDF